MRTTWWIGAVLIVATACDGTPAEDAGLPRDAGLDARVAEDAGRDAGADSGADAGLDAGAIVDAGGDAGAENDAGVGDAGADAEPTDAGPPPTCQDGPIDLGAWWGQVPPARASTTATAIDAGLGAVIAAVPVSDGVAAVDLDVTGAIVVAFAFPFPSGSDPAELFLADASGYIRTVDTPIAGLAVGDRVSFHVSEVRRFFGVPQITAIDTVTRTAATDDVPIVERHAAAITADDVNAVVHLHGEISALGSTECGGARCWELFSGSALHALRAPAVADIGAGSCVELVVPVSVFTGAPVLDVTHLSWLRTYCHTDAHCVTAGHPVCEIATGRCVE